METVLLSVEQPLYVCSLKLVHLSQICLRTTQVLIFVCKSYIENVSYAAYLESDC